MNVWNKKKKVWELKSGKPRGSGVHSAFETSMINFAAKPQQDLSGLVKSAIVAGGPALPEIQNEFDAATLLIDLTGKTQENLPSDTIIDAYAPLQGEPPKEFKKVPEGVASDLWDAVGDDTVQVMARGCRYLAHLWVAAWNAGNGDATIDNLSELSEDSLSQWYRKQIFIPSVTLDGIRQELDKPPA